MTRKDYELIAGVIRNLASDLTHYTDSSEVNLEAVARYLATAFVWENPRFDYERFLNACGIKENA